MNSVTSRLNTASILSTLRLLRSAKKEVFLIVEGDQDIDLFSNSLGVPRSNFVSCFGKERLIELFEMIPANGLDKGTIFLRDRDCDRVSSCTKNGVLLLVSERYDFEMSLLPNRIFERIFCEFKREKLTPSAIAAAFDKVVSVAASIGVLRSISHHDNLSLDFKETKLTYINASTLTIDIPKMVRYYLARSRSDLRNEDSIAAKVELLLSQSSDLIDVTCGKDFLLVLSVALNRHFRCCNAGESSIETLSRMFRIAVVHDDIKRLALYPLLVAQILSCGMQWMGREL